MRIVILLFVTLFTIYSCSNDRKKTTEKDISLISKRDSLFNTLSLEQKKLYNLFKIDLLSIPDSSFILIDKKIDKSKDTIYKYRKILDYEELGLFNTVTVVFFTKINAKNVIFNNYEAQKNWSKILGVTDKLYSILGDDDKGLGNYEYVDRQKYYSNRLYISRDWNRKNYAISFSPFGEEVGLTLWNVNHYKPHK